MYRTLLLNFISFCLLSIFVYLFKGYTITPKGGPVIMPHLVLIEACLICISEWLVGNWKCDGCIIVLGKSLDFLNFTDPKEWQPCEWNTTSYVHLLSIGCHFLLYVCLIKYRNVTSLLYAHAKSGLLLSKSFIVAIRFLCIFLFISCFSCTAFAPALWWTGRLWEYLSSFHCVVAWFPQVVFIVIHGVQCCN